MDSIFTELKQGDLKTLNLFPLFQSSVAAQKEFKTPLLTRNTNKALLAEQESAGDIIPRVLSAYADVEDYLNVMVRINPKAYELLVSEMDSLVMSLNTKLRKQRTTKPKRVVLLIRPCDGSDLFMYMRCC